MIWEICTILVFTVVFGTINCKHGEPKPEPDTALRREFFQNLKNAAYLRSPDRDECQSENRAQNSLAPKVCLNLRKDAEDGINAQINLELYSSYVYMAMATYFRRADVAMLNVGDFFQSASDEEREHAFMFIEYQNKRGGSVEFYPVKIPHKVKWSDTLDAMTDALDLEKRVYKALLRLHETAAKSYDSQVSPGMLDFIEANFLVEQVDTIKQLGNFVRQLTRLRSNDPGIGEFLFDKEIKDVKLHC